MMKYLLTIIFLFFMTLGKAQLSFSPDPIEVIANPFETEDIQVDFELNNSSEDTFKLAWTLNVMEQPESWQYFVCDTEICYNLGDSVSSLEKPNILNPNSSIIVMFHTLPSQTEGTGSYQINFFDVDNPDSILLEIPISVNTNITSSTSEVWLQNLSIFPNPARDYFRINTGDRIAGIDVLDILGKRIKQFKASQGKYYDISDLNAGMYYIRLKDEKGDVLKVLKLNKG